MRTDGNKCLLNQFIFFTKFAIMTAIEKINDEADAKPYKEPKPIGMAFLGHQVKAAEQTKNRY